MGSWAFNYRRMLILCHGRAALDSKFEGPESKNRFDQKRGFGFEKRRFIPHLEGKIGFQVFFGFEG
jgi:hypothetical protein